MMILTYGWAAEWYQVWLKSGGNPCDYVVPTRLGEDVWAWQSGEQE